MVFIFKNGENDLVCHNPEGDMCDENYILVSQKEFIPMSNNLQLLHMTDKKKAMEYSLAHDFNCCEIDCSPSFSSLKAYFYVENIGNLIQEKDGISLKESFENFLKKQNEGKFLYSDLKNILNNMSEEELNSPILIETSGYMGEEYHNIYFEKQDHSFLSLKKTSFKLTNGSLIFKE